MTRPAPLASGIPTTVIRPRSGWVGPSLSELWSFRELGYFLIWRDLKIRYRQTAFGLLWAVIQPVALMAVFSVVLGRTSGIVPAGVPYPLFAFAGLVPWTFFAQSLIASSDSLVESANLIRKVFFPRLLLPIASVGSFLIDLAIALVVLGVLMLWFGVAPTINVVWLIPLTGLAILAALGVGIAFSAINVRYRDVRYAVPFLVQVWLFASPVFYSPTVLPADLRLVYELNPMAGVVEGFRWALLGLGDAPVEAMVISAVVSIAAFTLGVAYFRRVELTFADVI